MIDQVIWARAIVPKLVSNWSYILIQVSQVSPTRLKGQKLLAQGVLFESFRLSARTIGASGFSWRANRTGRKISLISFLQSK